MPVHIDDPTTHTFLGAGKLPKVQQSSVERLVLHYDLLTHCLDYDLFSHLHRSPSGSFNFLPELISKSSHVKIVTLSTSHKELFKRIDKRFKKKLLSSLILPLPGQILSLRRLYRKREMYSDHSKLVTLYEKWCKFVDECNIEEHLMIDTTRPNVTIAKSSGINVIKETLSQEGGTLYFPVYSGGLS